VNFKYTIDSFDTAPSLDGFSNVVTRAIWTLTGTDTNGDTASTSASTEFAPPGEEFTAFDDLTEAIVTGWVEASADPAYLASRKVIIADLIAASKSPPAPAIPWKKEEATEVV